MKGIFREELRRAFKGKGMLLALAIGCTISISHVIQCQIPAYHLNQIMRFDKPGYPFNVSEMWIEGNSFDMQGFLYFYVMPLIAALPFGTSYFTDQKDGYLKGIYMRVSRKRYLSAKYTATFLSGGMAVVLPLILNLMCCMVLLPNLVAQTPMAHNGISGRNLFYEIYYTNPLVYILIFLCLDFVLAGLFACIALSCTFLSDYKIIIAIAPFFVQLTIHVLCGVIIEMPQWSSVFFTRSGFGLENLMIPLVYIVVGGLLTAGVFLYKGEREDVF